MDESLKRAIRLVRASFERCSRKADFIDIFYHRFSDRAPVIGPMFAQTDMSTQDTLVRAGIGHLINYADGVAGVDSKIHELALRHDRRHHAVSPELYPSWLDALVDAARECDARFDAEMEDAWRKVLWPGMELMASLY